MPAIAAFDQSVGYSVVRIVRLLYWDLLALQTTTPYRQARLRRMADQMQYVVQHWPAQTWPTLSPQGHPVLEQRRVLADLATLPSGLDAQHQYLLKLVSSLR